MKHHRNKFSFYHPFYTWTSFYGLGIQIIFYVIPIIGYISTPFLHIYVTVPWKKYITQYSSLFYVSNGNGSRLILNVFCIRYIWKSSWKNGTHQVLEKYISYIIAHCKIFLKIICAIYIKLLRNIDSVLLFSLWNNRKYEFFDLVFKQGLKII